MATLHLIHGFIASGKSTFAKKLEKQTKSIILNNDYFMRKLYGFNPPKDKFEIYYQNIEDIILSLSKKILSLDIDVIIDDGFWTKEKRRFMREFAKKNNVKVKFYNIKCDIKTAKERCLLRTKNKEKNQLFIDDKAFEKLLKNFEPMNEDETDTIIIYNS